MTSGSAQLHLLCGYAASGKSTFAATLAASENAVVISEDQWLAELFADELQELADFRRCSEKLRRMMGPHVVALLRAGQRVILDFQANTEAGRRWLNSLAQQAEVAVCLHHLDVPLDVCRTRAMARIERGDHPFALTPAQFNRLAAYFEPPRPEEGLCIVTHKYAVAE